MAKSSDSFTFTVGKLDAGMAILLGERAHLIEFPSLLLPPGATTGSIVNISVSQNISEEKKRDNEFWELQNDILEKYGTTLPEPPQLQLRNITQTSITLEWPQLNLATAKLRSLDIYRNFVRIAPIPSPLTNTSTKLSGLAIDTDYSFKLVLRTTAGTFTSNILRTRTHTMTDTSGISVCFGNVQDSVLLENAKLALNEMGAKWSDVIQIDTTHFVCTTPAATPSGAQVTGSVSSAPGVEYQKALQLSIPVVQPQWILACHSEKKMIAIHPYYLGASPATPMNSAPFTRPQSMSQASLPSPSGSRASPVTQKNNRQSMPPPQRVTSTSPPASSFVNQTQYQPPQIQPIEPTPEEDETSLSAQEETEDDDDEMSTRPRKGTMSKNFKFPPPIDSAVPPVPDLPTVSKPLGHRDSSLDTEEVALSPSNAVAEVPAPPPVEKERSPSGNQNDTYEELGETEEIELN
ncbi:hypothetical protein EUX98_g1865 [Antrodiella citrinella]|uniref:Fibronectin type-III domain-containing protein n=1 Tax=Antrodiella citrinella TaxID=2447956 RepID=A0A4V3XJC2_9APHY|nr:hypothetical protein EUX98_g1865 [Antrodiella citrinella]